MGRYEILDAQGNVANVIVATPAFVEQNYAGHYREVILPVVVIPPRRSRYEFLKKFTAQERKAIRQAAKGNADVEDFMDLLNFVSEVDCGNADTIAGVNALESAGLIAPGRAAQILA